jgi:hypothetical protein
VIATVTLTLALATAAQPLPSATPASEPSATAEPAPSAAGLPAPSSEPAAGASTAPAAAPSTVPSAAPTPDIYKYRFVPHQPAQPDAATPQIFEIFLNDQHLHSSGTIAIKVVTSTNVVKVITRSNGRDGVLPAIAPGDFEAISRLPKIPFIAAGMTTLLEFVGFTAEGKTVSVKIPVKIE